MFLAVVTSVASLCDSGPDHRLNYVSVQVSLIAIFKRLDLDLLWAARTAPAHSWRNPVERVMSTLNLGLQCVGLMREKRDDELKLKLRGVIALPPYVMQQSNDPSSKLQLSIALPM